jgi:hypothetical protein
MERPGALHVMKPVFKVVPCEEVRTDYTAVALGRPLFCSKASRGRASYFCQAAGLRNLD